jgi:hypothetical protein
MDPLFTTIGVWIAAILTIFVFTIVWKETSVYRICEYTVLGASAAHWLVSGMVSLQNSVTARLTAASYVWIVSFLIGFLYYARYVRKYHWLTRYPTAILTGTTIGLAIRGTIDSGIIAQLKASILPLTTTNSITNINNLVLTIFLVLPIWYFVSTYREPTGMRGGINKYMMQAARYMIMIDFGNLFGNLIVSRYVTLLGRIVFLSTNWLHIVPA